MCVIIDRPAGVPIPEKYLKTAINDNPDGWGWMYADNNELVCDWGMEEDDFFESYKNLPAEVHATLHFRWTTHGLTNVLNCHPFLIHADEYGVVHNGVIQTKIKYKELSDTYHFANGELSEALILYGHAFGGKQHKRLRKYFEHVVGSYNKLVILRKDGERMFINRKAGITHEGLWLSNNGPLTAPMSNNSKWARRYRKSGGSSYGGTGYQGWDDDTEGVGGYYGGYSGGAFSATKEKAPNVSDSVGKAEKPPPAPVGSQRMRWDKESRTLVPINPPAEAKVLQLVDKSAEEEVTESTKVIAARLEEKAETNPNLVSAAVSAALATASNPVDADYAFRLERIEQEKYDRAQARLKAQAEEEDLLERELIEHYMERNDAKEEEEAIKDYITGKTQTYSL